MLSILLIKLKRFLGLVEMNFGLVHTSYSLPEWQAVKLTIFAPLLWFTRTFRLTVACVPDQRIYIRLFCSLSSIAEFSDIILQSEI